LPAGPRPVVRAARPAAAPAGVPADAGPPPGAGAVVRLAGPRPVGRPHLVAGRLRPGRGVPRLRRLDEPGAERRLEPRRAAGGLGPAAPGSAGRRGADLEPAGVQAGLGGVLLPGAAADAALAHGGGDGGGRRRPGRADAAGRRLAVVVELAGD